MKTCDPISAAGRGGFSLIELIAAMTASAVLVISLAATVLISAQLLEMPPDDAATSHDRMIADRLASDLRYATSIDDNLSDGFALTRPDRAGLPQSITYQSHLSGMTRQVDGGPWVQLDPEPPGQQFFVDGYTAPSYVSPTTSVRVRSSTMATTSAEATSVELGVPPGCQVGDLLLLSVSAKNATSLTILDSGWQTLSVLSAGDLRLVVAYRLQDGSLPETIQIASTPASAMAAATVAIENASTLFPINWASTATGYALASTASTHPKPLESSGFDDRQLNVQIFAAELDPWMDGALGMAGFVDVVQATAAEDDGTLTNTVAVVIRNGAAPELSTPPTLLHQDSGYWLQTAVRVEASP